MRIMVLASITAMVVGAAPVAAGDLSAAPPHIGRYTTSPDDVQAIRLVAADFQAAIKTKDVRQLSSLLMNTEIPFVSPPAPETIQKIRARYDANADGLRAGGYHDFARFVRESKVPIEERFYNLKITQDRNVAWAMFDYEFVDDGKVSNYGIETWQMMKNGEGKWKIASVWWTTNPMP